MLVFIVISILLAFSFAVIFAAIFALFRGWRSHIFHTEVHISTASVSPHCFFAERHCRVFAEDFHYAGLHYFQLAISLLRYFTPRDIFRPVMTISRRAPFFRFSFRRRQQLIFSGFSEVMFLQPFLHHSPDSPPPFRLEAFRHTEGDTSIIIFTPRHFRIDTGYHTSDGYIRRY